ncbi:MAG: 2-amino-4-hydroxy-6-hydroxymethyldihydropteridine diphosphokinase [Alphaproteobacteria bacterium]|nr:2-amino-4-hydroxy-6-hydroxymethyldihydropteridine diphosphokinase [Alphaproteobacteria bacterium]
MAALHAQPEAEVLRVSRVYLSPPAGGIARGSFLNAALRLRWAGALPGCSPAARRLERRLGRRPARALGGSCLGPRPALVARAGGGRARAWLPHRRSRRGPFAWAPLLDVWPGARDPRTGQAYGGGLAPAVVGVLQRPD